MSSTMFMERSGVGMQGFASPTGAPMAGPGPGNWCVLPSCKMKIEKCTGGLKITCKCDDAVACAMMQNLCNMLAGGMCSCSCMMNGMMVCNCNMIMGMCKTEMTKDGCIITCTSGDAGNMAMIQGCCDCMAACLKAGCTVRSGSC